MGIWDWESRRELTLGWKEQCIPSPFLLQAHQSVLPPRGSPPSTSQAYSQPRQPLSPPPRPPSLAYSGTPSCPLFFQQAPHSCSTPSAPPTRYNRFLEKRAPPWPSHSRLAGEGLGRAPLPLRGAARVSGADRAGWAGRPGDPAAEGGARGRGRFPGVAAAGAVRGQGPPFGFAGPGQTSDVAKPPPTSPPSPPGEGAQCRKGQPREQCGGLWRAEGH